MEADLSGVGCKFRPQAKMPRQQFHICNNPQSLANVSCEVLYEIIHICTAVVDESEK